MSVRLGLRLSLACVALFSIAKIGMAQTKVAIVNLQRAVLESAEIKKASADMEAKYKPRQAEIEKLNKEIQTLAQQLQANAGKYTPQAEAELNAKGKKMQVNVQRMTDDLQSDVEHDRTEILQRSTKKMQEIVKKIAEEKGLDVVVDVNNTIYYKPALEITDEALAAYNKAYPVATTTSAK